MNIQQSQLSLIPYESSKETTASVENWNGHTVTFPFPDLIADLQGEVILQCDDSTQMMLHLTNWTFYRLPTNPHMSWSAFARAAMLDGNTELVKMGLEMGIPLEYFIEYAEEAAKLNHSKVFDIEEIEEIINDENWKRNFFRSALAYAAQNNLIEDYQWITKKFKISNYNLNEYYTIGFLRASNIIELEKINAKSCFLSDYVRQQALVYANEELMDWLLKNKFFDSYIQAYDFDLLGCREGILFFDKLYNNFSDSSHLMCAARGAALYDNVELLEHLEKLDVIFTREHLHKALCGSSFKAFAWLLKKVEWDPTLLVSIQPDYNKFPKKEGFAYNWLSDIIAELKKQNLYSTYDELPYYYLDQNSFINSNSKDFFHESTYRLTIMRAPDNYNLVKFLLTSKFVKELSPYDILKCKEASFSQMQTLFRSPWVKKRTLEEIQLDLKSVPGKRNEIIIKEIEQILKLKDD